VTSATTIVERALEVADRTRNDLTALLGGRGAVVLEAVAGAGKSTFIAETVGLLGDEGVTLAVAAPTNEQVFSLVAGIARRNPRLTITYVPRSGLTLTAQYEEPNIVTVESAAEANGEQIVVGTLDKLADAYHRGDLCRAECLIIDEAYQADAGRYYRAADLADVHLLVGDSGQIDPFSTTEEAQRYRGLDEDPVRTAVEVLLANHPSTARHDFPITRRLDTRAAELARCFYRADHEFEAAVGAGERELRFRRAAASDDRTAALDLALETAAERGVAHLELPSAAVLSADPDSVAAIVDTVARLLERRTTVRCEREPKFKALKSSAIAISASHNDQVRALRRELYLRGMSDVVVSTANKLQGLEFDVSVCWHPLAGLPDTDVFHLEAGRLCVMATRHRHACIVVGRESDRALLGGLPPAAPAFLGRTDEPLLSGWDTHRAFFDAVSGARVPLPVR
jgi:hypothetical protein